MVPDSSSSASAGVPGDFGVLLGLRGRTPLKLNSYFCGLPNLNAVGVDVAAGALVDEESGLKFAIPNVKVDGGATEPGRDDPKTKPEGLGVVDVTWGVDCAEKLVVDGCGVVLAPGNPKVNLAGATPAAAVPTGNPPPPETGAANFSNAFKGDCVGSAFSDPGLRVSQAKHDVLSAGFDT